MSWNVVWSQAITKPLAAGLMIKKNKTVEFPVFLNQGGTKLKIHLVNKNGKKPYRFGGMSIVYQGRIYRATVAGNEEFSVTPKMETYSDEVEITMVENSELFVRIHYYNKFQDTNSIVEEAVQYEGNAAFQLNAIPMQKKAYEEQYGVFKSIPAIDRIEIENNLEPRQIIAFGDSITAMNRWVKPLSHRLYDAYGSRYTLLNSGISGNCLTLDPTSWMYQSFGIMGIRRYSTDVLSFSHVYAVILAFGINDIAFMTEKDKETVNIDRLIRETQNFADMLHGKGIRVICQTLGPRKGYQKFSDEMENNRQKYNQWVRTCGIFDYVVDPEPMLLEDGTTDSFKTGLHQGDNLHPNKEGGFIMANAYDLEKLTGESM